MRYRSLFAATIPCTCRRGFPQSHTKQLNN